MPTSTSSLENGQGGPPVIYGKRPDTCFTDNTTLKIPWSYHQLPHMRQHLQVTNVRYLFT